MMLYVSIVLRCDPQPLKGRNTVVIFEGGDRVDLPR